MRLNGYQRIGVVASALWFIGGGIWGNRMGIAEGDWVVRVYQSCIELHPFNDGRCDRAFDRDWPIAIQYHWWEALIVATVPIILGWLVAYALIGIVTWVRKGFADVSTK